ncbi:MAG: patatin-like phospholipase family protein [Flavobacteriaceae bacterium]
MRFSLLIFCLFLTPFLRGQNIPDSLKIGLVLSGGGAKGLAHIGVLKALEEAKINIDYIAGSSMGAIIGGLYATGYSADQLDSLFQQTDFSEIFNDSFGRQQLDFDEKRKRDRYAIRLNFHGNKWHPPPALASGRAFYHLLQKWLHGYTNHRSFDTLHIPFVCTATDLETGEVLYLEAGDLAMAIHASAALPTLFEPVAYHGKWLMDGGITDNYPIDILKEKGVDYIIGVDVQEDLVSRDELQTAPQILLQIANFGEVATRPQKVNQTDCYIKLPLEEYGILSFAQGRAIIAEGYHSGKNAFTESNWRSENYIPQHRPNVSDSVSIDKIHMEGLHKRSEKRALAKLRLPTPGQFRLEEMQQAIDRLSATKLFRNAQYRWHSQNSNDLIITLIEWDKPAELKAGLHYDQLFASAALVNIDYAQVLLPYDNFSFDLILGDQPRFDLRYSFHRGYKWAIDLYSSFYRFETRVDHWRRFFPAFSQQLPSGAFDLRFSDWTNGIRSQRVLGEWMQFCVGFAHKRIRYSTPSGTPLDRDALQLALQEYWTSFVELTIDKRDHAYFPTKGILFKSQMNHYLSQNDGAPEYLATTKGLIQSNSALSKNLALQIEGAAGWSYGHTEKLGFPFIAGGYGNVFVNNSFSFLGYSPWELSGDSFLKFFGQLDFKFAKKHHLNLSYTRAYIEDDVFEAIAENTAQRHQSWAFGYGFDSILGPCEIKLAQSNQTSEIKVHLVLGYRF